MDNIEVSLVIRIVAARVAAIVVSLSTVLSHPRIRAGSRRYDEKSKDRSGLKCKYGIITRSLERKISDRGCAGGLIRPSNSTTGVLGLRWLQIGSIGGL